MMKLSLFVFNTLAYPLFDSNIGPKVGHNRLLLSDRLIQNRLRSNVFTDRERGVCVCVCV